MKNTFGNSLTATVFGESHGEALGIVIDGISPGITVDNDFIKHMLSLRKAGGPLSTARGEADEFRILSGVFNGKTTGTPLCIMIENQDTNSSDYDSIRHLMRPSHADYTAECKYLGFQDYRGGGHFSGRITAALVAGGAIFLSALKEKGIRIATHITRLGGISDREFKGGEDFDTLETSPFPVLDEDAALAMKEKIKEAKNDCDSIGGVLETVIDGIPAGVGEPMFDTLEGMLSHAMFAIPGIKGIEFGLGFGFADKRGSTANDAFEYDCDKIVTTTNNNGGINGGISNGMPIVLRLAVKPTPSIFKEQNTVNITTEENAKLQIKGRHDPAIIHRAKAVVDCVAALVISDMLTSRFGTNYLSDGDGK